MPMLIGINVFKASQKTIVNDTNIAVNNTISKIRDMYFSFILSWLQTNAFHS